MRMLFAMAAAAAMLFCGCARDEGKDAAAGAGASEASVVTPERELELRTKLFLASNPRAGAADAAQLRAVFERTSARHFAEQRVLMAIAAENGIDADAAEVASQLRPLEGAMTQLSEAERADVMALGRAEVVCGKVRDALFDDFYEDVTDDDIGKVRKWSDELAAASAATNAAVRERAAEAWRRLAAGGDFAALAREYSEADEAPAYDWGEFALDEFDDSPELRKALEGMQPGEFSQPVEGDNGLVIVRLTAIDQDSMPPKYSLDRIFFRLAEDVPEYPEDEIRTAIANKFVNEFISGEIEKLSK